ncbi:hypothetical protein Tco_1556753 [Tanacetum coccineum]
MASSSTRELILRTAIINQSTCLHWVHLPYSVLKKGLLRIREPRGSTHINQRTTVSQNIGTSLLYKTIIKHILTAMRLISTQFSESHKLASFSLELFALLDPEKGYGINVRGSEQQLKGLYQMEIAILATYHRGVGCLYFLVLLTRLHQLSVVTSVPDSTHRIGKKEEKGGGNWRFHYKNNRFEW